MQEHEHKAISRAREVLNVKVETLNQILSALNQELMNKDQVIKELNDKNNTEHRNKMNGFEEVYEKNYFTFRAISKSNALGIWTLAQQDLQAELIEKNRMIKELQDELNDKNSGMGDK